MEGKKPNKSAEIRELLATGMRPARVAERVGVRSGAVGSAKRKTGPRGRPRKTVHPAEACARYLEHLEKLAIGLGARYDAQSFREAKEGIRSGRWKEFIESER